MKTCPACAAEAADDAGFCPRCGTRLSSTCGNCGAALPEEARFCSACGAPVGQLEPPRERKLVTVLFADVTGYTGLGERLDAERLKEVMDAYFAAMREAIEAEGGTVEKFIGDAVMAVFGAPVAHEDDPDRALRAALGMRTRLGGLNETLMKTHEVTLEIRIGVNSGEVLAVADPRPGAGLVTGDAVSVAARLEQNAQPGEILVAERVARATRGFTFTEVGALELKGKGHPIRALRLVAEDRAAERGIQGLRAPLVGRDSEMALLDSLFARVAAEGRPHLVTVYGDPGVGKSRLVAEFIQRVETGSRAPLVVSGRCLPYGEGVTYWPLAEILKRLAGALDSDAPGLVVEKIRKLGRDLLTPDVAADPARATAALAYTVGVEDPEVSFRDLSPRQVRLETHSAWRSFFSALAAERAVVALIEDIHWADSALLDLLEEVADRMQGPVLLVCPARPELTQRRPAWGGGKRNFSSIFLDPLSPDEAGRLIEFLLSIEDLPGDVHGRILERSEGNPFFLEEIIRHMIDEGRIVHEGGRWRGTADCDEVTIPDTVQGVLAARIDLLSPEEKRVAQSAAVVGRVFWTGPLRRLVGSDVDDVLERLETRELIRARLSSSIGGDREFIFKHVLTRDVAYESLPRRERAAAHASVASWLQETAGDRRREFAELLAHHYVEALQAAGSDARTDAASTEALRVSAFQHTLLASIVARDRFALEAARRLAERALNLAADASERSAGLESLGLTHQLDYRGDDAWRYLKQAVDEAVDDDGQDDRSIARLCAEALETPTRYPGSMHQIPAAETAVDYLELGMSHAERVPGDSPELARMLTIRSFWPYGFPGKYPDDEYDQASADGWRAAEMARRLGLPELASAALDGAGSAWMIRALYRDAVEVVDRRLELAADIRDPWEIGDMYAVASWVHYMTGAYHASLRFAEEGLRRVGDSVPAVTLHLLSWRALTRYRLGDWDGAIDDLQTSERLLGDRRLRPPSFTTRTFAAVALIHEARGNSAAADELIALLSSLVTQTDLTLGRWADWFAPIRLYRGDIDGAIQIVKEGLSDPRQPGLRPPVYEALCNALAAAERWDEALREAPTIRAYAERGGLQTIQFALDRLEGRAALARGDNDTAGEFLTRSARGFEGLGAVWEGALSWLTLGEALIGMGRPSEAAEPLRHAVAVFERLGAVRELARARTLQARLDERG